MSRVVKVLAPNPGLFTGPGTNTWIISDRDEGVVIDPGPMIDRHLAAIENAAAGLRVTAVAVTHTHPDHAPAANPLAERWKVPACGFAPGPAFLPDRTLDDGDEIEFGNSRLGVVHTPGHTADHVCYLHAGRLFTGDHMMGGSTVVMEDLAAYLESLRKVIALAPERIHPGHGPDIEDPVGTAEEYLAHRLERELQIVAALRAGAATVGDIVEAVYTDVPPELHPAAAISVSAHLRKLDAEGRVAFAVGEAEWTAQVGLIEEAS